MHGVVCCVSLCNFLGHADVDVRCASTYFRYGAALFYKAQDEQDVFGSSLQAATTHEDAEAAEEESSGEQELHSLCSILHNRAHELATLAACHTAPSIWTLTV